MQMMTDDFTQSAYSLKAPICVQRQAQRPKPRGATNDESLDSLTRQASLIERQEEMRSLELETLLEGRLRDPDDPTSRFPVASNTPSLQTKTSRLGGLRYHAHRRSRLPLSLLEAIRNSRFAESNDA